MRSVNFCFSTLELYALSARCFPIDSMNEMDHGAVASTSADNGISTSSNGKRPTRRSRICKKCSRSVKNLSRHQQEVHGMSKMRRKLDGYLTGEKKAPNRRVKFCPLSPCKRSRTPIFQLDKHLQSGVHNLKPKMSTYVRALAHAPRASLSNVDSYLKRQRKQRARTREQAKSEKRNNEDYDACDEADNSNEQNVKCNPEDHDMYSDQDYEELGRRAQRKIRNKKRIAQEKKHSEEDSDEEYDRLARKVWKNSEVEKTRTRAKKQNTSDSNSDSLLNSDEEYRKLVSGGLNKECKRDIMESNGRETTANGTEDKCEEEIYDTEESTNNGKKNEGFQCVEISDSDESRKLDPDYLCSEESDSDTCTQSDTSIPSSCSV